MGRLKDRQERKQTVVATRGVVRFLLARKEYAVDMGLVREVIYGSQVRPLPGVPDYFEGLIDLRGTVIPVIHLGRRLGARGSSDTTAPLEHILIMEINHKKVGFIVDQVEDVLVIESESVQPAQNLLEGAAAVMEGVFRHQDRLILLLSLERLFTPEMLHQMAEALEPTPVGV